MDNNTLGILAVSLVALGGIATIALEKNKIEILAQTGSGGSDDAKYGIIIQDDLTPAQWTAVYNVVNGTAAYSAANRKELYRIGHFIKGKEVPPSPPDPHSDPNDLDSGHLPVNQLLGDKDKIIQNLPIDFTGYAFQIGVGGKDSFQRFPITAPSMPQAHGKINMRESKEMVEEVNDVLNQP